MSRRRAIVEYMPEVTAAGCAMDFGAHHTVAAIDGRLDRAIDRLIEARPSGPALELELRLEKRLAAAYTRKSTGSLLLQQSAASRRLGAMLAHHAVLLGRQHAAPLRFGMHYGIRLFHDSFSLR